MTELALRGTIVRILGGEHLENWRLGLIRVHDEEGDTIKFAGTCVPEIGETWTLHGSWHNHPKYGHQFKVTWGLKELATTWEGMQKVLERDSRFQLIGPKRSRYVQEALEEMGGDLETILSNEDESARFRKKARLPRRAVRKLKEEWVARREEHETKGLLINLGLTPRIVDKLWRNLGKNATQMISENPYVVLDLADDISFETIDQIALKKLGTDRGSPKRLEAGLAETLRSQREEGHVWISRGSLVSRAMGTLGIGRLGDKALMTKRLDELLAAEDDRLVLSTLEPMGEVIAPPALYKYETKVAEFFDPALKDEPNPHFKNYPFDPASLAWIIKPDYKGVTRTPNEAQVAALVKATQKKRLVITGPAGAGKTTVASALVKIYQERDKRVAIGAPTGKAAKRLMEVLSESGSRPITWGPSTIHRLLRCRGFGEWEHQKSNPLPADVLLLDEGSMIDAELMSRVIDALDPNCALVVIGDPHQLPSVGPGAVLRDLVYGERCEVAKLEKVMRHAGVMRANAEAILKGVMTQTTQEKDLEGNPAFDDNGSPVIPWTVESTHSGSSSALKSISAKFEELITREGKEGLFETQVLSPQYKGVVGINSLNRTLQKIAQRVLYDNEVESQDDETGKPKLLPGDKVVQTKNDYSLDLMNGEYGVVSEITKDSVTLGVERQKGKLTYITMPKEASECLMLAWAASIHRCQGSQWEYIIVAAHSEHSMLNRKLVYTAATRATKSITLIGDHGGLYRSLAKTNVDHRRTFMAPKALLEKLAEESGNKVTT